jgi:hypothetical protein
MDERRQFGGQLNKEIKGTGFFGSLCIYEILNARTRRSNDGALEPSSSTPFKKFKLPKL